MKQLSYKIYPSLLDSFERYLRAEETAEEFWNIDNETGEYIKSPEDIEEELKQNLINSINRVPFDSEAADKGTAFNEVIDCLVHKRKPDEDSRVSLSSDKETNTITATVGARTFMFDLAWCKDEAEYFKGSASQVFVSAILPTRYGDVLLYGYTDEIKRDIVYDIKTTSRYEFCKYEHGWQRHVYPYCLIESGQMSKVRGFEYTAYQLRGGTSRTPNIIGTRYPELYTYNHEQSTKLLTNHVEHFIEFLLVNHDLITDKKIFAEV